MSSPSMLATPASMPPTDPLADSSAPGGRSLPTVLDPLNFTVDDSLAPGRGGAGAGARGGGREGGRGDDTASDAGRPARSGRRRVREQMDQIPRVKDATGEKVMEAFTQFLDNFAEDVQLAETPGSMPPSQHDSEDRRYYVDQIKGMQDFESTTLFVDFSHLLERDEVVARAVRSMYYRFLPYLKRSVQALVRKYCPTYAYLSTSFAPSAASTAGTSLVTRDFSISFYNMPLVNSIRDLRMDKVGQLVSISGTVTRTSEVRPELVSGTFRCEACNAVISDVEQQFKYTEPVMCQNGTCQNRSAWHLLIEQSKFSDWQKVRIQENANEIPTGSMPRSLDVILRSDTVERAKAGDKCNFTGTFIVVPDVSQLGLPGVNAEMQRQAQGGRREQGGVASQGVTGLKALGVRDLQYKTAFLGCTVQQADTRSSGVRNDLEEGEEDQHSFLNSLTQQEVDELKNMVNTDNIYQKLVESIAPTVYGHEIVKKGILLQLMGGVHKQTPEGIHLRGDINVCIVGDPSTSKSQFLKYVCGFLPRAVYTSGKASSAAGLTAAVVRDEESGEFTIEAGALMLADNGICAIDEFDKMDISDQVAIHEAMEQQTISIAKAGIQATLNARTSILAAANPVGGRYNRKISLRANVAMSAPIMSRFDLFFVVLDECNENVDTNIAQHIVNVHRFRDLAISPDFSTEALQRYIRYARTFKPKLTTAASAVLVEKYRQLRQDDSGVGGKNSYRITVRQLESMIRLSEAIARANCSSDITPQFVREAFALLRQSIIHVEQDDIDFEDDEDAVTATNGRLNVDNLDDEDVRMDEADLAALESFDANGSLPNGNSSSSAPAAPNGVPSSAAEGSGKRRLKITYNKYMEIMNLCVLHLSDVERETGEGVDREELIEWYLEQKEQDFETVEQMEAERELIGKALTKLAKDNYLMELRGQAGEGLAPSAEDEATPADDGKIHYVVHPQVDLSDLASPMGA